MDKEQIILGGLLGDAYISKLNGRRKTCSISWEHSSKQKDYALWKAKLSLDNYSIYERDRFDKRTNKTYSSITVYSTKNDYVEFRELFYQNGIKVITTEILNKLKPLGIAIWFMDDGSLYYNGHTCHLGLAVDCFNEYEIGLIIDFFKTNYGINFKKTQKRLRLTSVKEVKTFEKHFKEFIPECMLYKTLDFVKKEYDNNLTDDRKNLGLKNIGKTYIIADIHGGYKALLQVLKKSGFDKKKDTLIFLGDICDGWSQVYECVEELLTIENLIPLQANHDDSFLKFIRFGKHPKDWDEGGLATKQSYERNLGVEVLNNMDIPREHVRFFNSAHLYYIDDNNRMFVHGGWDRNFLVKDLKSSDPEEFFWDRLLWRKALTCQQGKLKTADGFDEIFIGHTATINWKSRKEEIVKTADGETRVVKKKQRIDYPMYSAGIWNLDTGCGFYGRLTIMDVDTKEFWQSDLVNELYPNEINLK